MSRSISCRWCLIADTHVWSQVVIGCNGFVSCLLSVMETVKHAIQEKLHLKNAVHSLSDSVVVWIAGLTHAQLGSVGVH